MKLPGTHPFGVLRGACPRGFTVLELQIAVPIMLLALGAVMMGHLAGLRMLGFTRLKLEAGDSARAAVGWLSADIRTAKRVEIGSGSFTTFAMAPGDGPQRGQSLQIYPGTNTNTFIRYYFDPADAALKRMTNDELKPVPIARGLETGTIFTAENHAGVPLTARQDNRAIAINLRFRGAAMPGGTNGSFGAYQLCTKVTRRVHD